ncbi:MAG: hypothetical protein J6U71_07680 [Bacteroidales bacterium]|nr:hypothetical protein [Bacteroidales bacterium]
MLNRLYGFHRDVNEELVNYAISEIISDYSYSFADLMKADRIMDEWLRNQPF